VYTEELGRRIIIQEEFEVIEDIEEEEEIIRHEGKTYRNLGAVKDTQAGDLVRFYRSFYYESTIGGKLYEVDDQDRYYDESGDSLDIDGWGGYENREVFRLVEDEEEDDLKVGDRVEIVDTSLYILHANQRTGTIV